MKDTGLLSDSLMQRHFFEWYTPLISMCSTDQFLDDAVARLLLLLRSQYFVLNPITCPVMKNPANFSGPINFLAISQLYDLQT